MGRRTSEIRTQAQEPGRSRVRVSEKERDRHTDRQTKTLLLVIGCSTSEIDTLNHSLVDQGLESQRDRERDKHRDKDTDWEWDAVRRG